MPALSVKLRVLLTAAGSIGPFAAHGVRLELRPYFERERRERGELGGEDERRVLDGGARVLGPGRGVRRFDADGDEGPDDGERQDHVAAERDDAGADDRGAVERSEDYVRSMACAQINPEFRIIIRTLWITYNYFECRA